MRGRLAVIAAVQATLVVGMAAGMRAGWLPRGVPAEWEWPLVTLGTSPVDACVTLAGASAYAGFAGLGMRALGRRGGAAREAAWLAALAVAAVAVQALIPGAAPDGFNLGKWTFPLHSRGSSGYYTVAKWVVGDAPGRFLAEYPAWVRGQDSLHIGTHPPGLFLVDHGLLRAMEASPGAARWVTDHLPPSVAIGFRQINTYSPLPRPDRAALALVGGLTLACCALTALPLYVLARCALPAAASWAVAALWPVVPASILFNPTADTAFPLLSTSALALIALATRPGRSLGLPLAAGSGLVLALGMQFSLVFLPAGLIVGLACATAAGLPARRRGALVLATGAGFLAPTLGFWAATTANPFAIWWTNQVNHGRFYDEYHRSYGTWIWVNPVELAVALGLPAVAWIGLGFGAPRAVPRATWLTLGVLVLLDLSGKNLSEVPRLWLPFMPPLLLAAGPGLVRLGGGPWTVAATAWLMAAEAVALELWIQVVYHAA